jgi:hypothetical protein
LFVNRPYNLSVLGIFLSKQFNRNQTMIFLL